MRIAGSDAWDSQLRPPGPRRPGRGKKRWREMGQKCLATGISMAMRLWDEESPASPRELSRREYETIGIVISSRAPVPLRANGRAWC